MDGHCLWISPKGHWITQNNRHEKDCVSFVLERKKERKKIFSESSSRVKYVFGEPWNMMPHLFFMTLFSHHTKTLTRTLINEHILNTEWLVIINMRGMLVISSNIGCMYVYLSLRRKTDNKIDFSTPLRTCDCCLLSHCLPRFGSKSAHTRVFNISLAQKRAARLTMAITTLSPSHAAPPYN